MYLRYGGGFVWLSMSFFDRLTDPENYRPRKDGDEEDDTFTRLLLIAATAIISAYPVYSVFKKSRAALDGQSSLQAVVYLTPLLLVLLLVFAFYRSRSRAKRKSSQKER